MSNFVSIFSTLIDSAQDVIKIKTLVLALMVSLVACNNAPSNESQLTIAVASNMHSAMEDIAMQFTQKTGISVQVSSASSGVLTAQIRQGAPFDVFLSANMAYPKALYQQGFTDGRPKTYAYGSLILWSVGDIDTSAGLAALTQSNVKNFAIANPETAPYGIAAIQALEGSGFMSEIKNKMVVGESVGQVNQYVSSGTVQVGLTSTAVLFSSTLGSKGVSHKIDNDLYEPIEQGIVILKMGLNKNPEASKLFQNFMFSPETGAVLIEYGFSLPRDSL